MTTHRSHFRFGIGLVTSGVILSLSIASPSKAESPPAKPGAAAVIPPAPAGPTAAQVQASQAEAKKLSDGFVGVAEKVSASVVQIDVAVRDERADAISRFFGRPSGFDSPVARSFGSGVIFTADGAIVTNNHVVEEALSVTVRLHDGRKLPARILGRDPESDLAVLKVDATGLAPAKFSDSETVRVGEWVVALGSPFALGYTVTAGIVSAKGRSIPGSVDAEDYIQTDASINPGNSGGPLCDLDSHVLGINTMIMGKGTGIGFAVPSNMVQRVAQQILKTGRMQRPWAGVGIQSLTPDVAGALKIDARSGALVNNVSTDGPAYRANIRPGDVISAVGGKPVHDAHELTREILSHEVGEQVVFEIFRAGQRYGTTVAMVARPEKPVAAAPVEDAATPKSGMGLAVRDLLPEQATKMGLPHPYPLVSRVAPGSAADRNGLRQGDVIIEVNGTIDPTAATLQAASGSGEVLLRLRRGDNYFYAALTTK